MDESCAGLCTQVSLKQHRHHHQTQPTPREYFPKVPPAGTAAVLNLPVDPGYLWPGCRSSLTQQTLGSVFKDKSLCSWMESGVFASRRTFLSGPPCKESSVNTSTPWEPFPFSRQQGLQWRFILGRSNIFFSFAVKLSIFSTTWLMIIFFFLNKVQYQ